MLTEQELVRKGRDLLFAGVFAVIAIAVGYATLDELNPADRDNAALVMWVAAVAAAIPGAVVGWRKRHEKPVQKGAATGLLSGLTVVIFGTFVDISPAILTVVLGAGGGYMAGLFLGTFPGVAPVWLKKWKRDFG